MQVAIKQNMFVTKYELLVALNPTLQSFMYSKMIRKGHFSPPPPPPHHPPTNTVVVKMNPSSVFRRN